MSIDFYWISGSAPAWRVQLALEVKNLNYQSHILETSKKEQKQPWFLELSPRGQIPLIKDNDIVVRESLAILHYLEKQYPDTPLFGKSAEQTATIAQSVHEILSYVDSPIGKYVQIVFRNKIEENQQQLNDISENIHAELNTLNDSMTGRQWLADTVISAADIVFIPTFHRLLRAINKAPDLSKQYSLHQLSDDYPCLGQWNDNVVKLNAFDASFPPHWR